MTAKKEEVKVTRAKLPTVNFKAFYMGCDPEFFFRSAEGIVGAELILPKNGLNRSVAAFNDGNTDLDGTSSKFVIDGVQAELNPRPNTCRANLANEISACFKTLQKELAKQTTKVTLDFSQSVSVTKKELQKLDENNQKFGCTPSINSYKDSGCKLAKVDPLKYKHRSAGGHIHLGTDNYPEFKAAIAKDPNKIVTMLDIIVGNTCVLIDRDKGNKVRRKLYGRAGEYRLPKHGLEYRTLSNFWLTSYPLMSFVFGLARLAVNLSTGVRADKYYEAFTSVVKLKDVQKAINNNDFDLAMKNFKAIEPLLLEANGISYGSQVFDTYTIDEFHYFVKTVNEHGMQHWFKEDPMTHWTNLPECHTDGFFYFLKTKVRPELIELKKNEKIVL